jgi:O-antigen/teichoic acid export membrane protein
MLFRNSVAQTAALVAGYVFSFVLAPIMLARLGLSQFGVWAVTGAIATYAGLMDLGITRALGRFIAVHHTNGDRRAMMQCFTLGLLAVAWVASIAIVLALLVAGFVADKLDGVLSTGDMRIVLVSSVAISALNAWRSVLRSVPEGMQRFVEPNIAEVGFATTNFVFSLVALIVSRDLVVYAVANAASGVVGLAITSVALRKVFGPIRPSIPPRPLVREVMGFAIQNQLAWIADLAAGQAAKIILAVSIDVRAAGAYEIANRAVVAAKSVAVMSVSAMVPTATARITAEGRQIIGDFYRRYNARSLSVSLPLIAFLCSSAPALLVAWLGKVPTDSMWVFIALSLANCVNLTTGVAYSLSLGEGRAGMIASVSAFSAIVTVGAMAGLAQAFELWGVVAGGVLGIVAGAVVYMVYFHRVHHLPPGDYIRSAGTPALIAALAGVPIALSWIVVAQPDGRLPAFAISIVDLFVYLAIYWPIADRLELLPDALRLRRLGGRLRRLRRRTATSAAG